MSLLEGRWVERVCVVTLAHGHIRTRSFSHEAAQSVSRAFRVHLPLSTENREMCIAGVYKETERDQRGVYEGFSNGASFLFGGGGGED